MMCRLKVNKIVLKKLCHIMAQEVKSDEVVVGLIETEMQV
jgi:hypothetical protein